MGRRIAQGFILAGLAVLMLTAGVGGASAQVHKIDACQTLTVFGATYRLIGGDLFACGTCLVVAANRITIDLQNFAIVQDIGCFTGAAITDDGVAREQITVKNGSTFSDDIGSFDYGVDLRASTRTEVRSFGTFFNNVDGIAVGNRALVKDSLSVANAGSGISGGDSVQVQSSGAFLNGAAGGSDLAGIRVGNRCLVTQNDASFSNVTGIITGASCTVTQNLATDNASGIAVGSNSLVSQNTAADNLDEGISVQCPGTVTNNTLAGNGENLVLVGKGCFDKGNQ